MPALAAELALPELHSSRRQFDRAAASFMSASFIHEEARRRLLERLEGLRIKAGTLVDLGSAYGHGAEALAKRFPEASVVAVDSSREMLRRSVDAPFSKLAAMAEKLPLPDRSVALIFANLILPWARPEAIFAEAGRVLDGDGLVLFSTLGPDSLQEIRRAWAQVDKDVHVHACWDMQTLGDIAIRAGLEEPVLDVDRIKVSYSDLHGLISDLRACGATNIAGGRRRGLTGRGRWQRFVQALRAEQGAGRLSFTVELILGQAWGRRQGVRSASNGEIVVPLDRLSLRR